MILQENFIVKKHRLQHPIIDSILLYKLSKKKEYLLVPEGCFELIFELNGATKQKFFTKSNWIKRPNYFIGGLHNASYIVEPETKNQFSVGIKLKPDTAHLFLNDKYNLNHFKNQIVDVREVLNNSFKELLKNIIEQNSFEKMCRFIIYFFDKFYSAPKNLHQKINTSKIIKNNGRINISELSKNAAMSKSHYRKVFRETIGLSPREFSKIIRINTAISFLQRKNANSLTQIALDLGYFDQSHFIKEFKSVVKLTPSSFLA